MARIGPYTFQTGDTPARYERAPPVDLNGFLPIKSFNRSLKTANHREALKRSKLVNVEFEAFIAEARRAKSNGWPSWESYRLAERKIPTPGDTFVRAPEPVYRAALAHSFQLVFEAVRDELEADPPNSRADAISRVGVWNAPIRPFLKSPSATFLADLDENTDPFAPPPPFTHQRMLDALRLAGLLVDPNDILHRRHWRVFATVTRSFMRERDDVLLAHGGDTTGLERFVDTVPDLFSPRAPATFREVAAAPVHQAAPPERPSPSPLYTTVFDEILSTGTQSGNTKEEIRTASDLFLEIIGDKPIAEFTRADAREFERVLRALPANWRRHGNMRTLHPKDAAAFAIENKIPPANLRTTHKTFGFVSSVWKKISLRYEDKISSNPFRDLTIKRPAIDPRAPKDNFEIEELKIIFDAPLYRGMLSPEKCHMPGKLIDRESWRYWAPLVSMYTGFRTGEILSLVPDDIQNEQGIIVIRLQPTSQRRYKTLNATRTTPIHSMLIKLGFLSFVERRRSEGAEQLFKDARKDSADGTWSEKAASFYGRFLKKTGVKRKGISFYSFRHNFDDALKNAGAHDALIRAFQGHGDRGMGSIYGRGHNLKIKSEWIEKVEYAGLDLSHLFPVNW